MSIVVYAEYLLKSDIKHDFTMIYILEIPIVASYFTLFLKFNILTIMLIL